MNEKNSLIHIPSGEMDVCDLGAYPYSVFPSIVTLNSLTDLEKAGVSKVQRNPNLALFGAGVIIGLIDTGIDYRHEAFLYSDGTSRILTIWDQTIQDGLPPEGFSYGTEYNTEKINFALKSEDPFSVVPSTDENGHGTALASIIAGGENLENSFRGIVPSAQLAVVKLKQAKQNTRNIYFVPEDVECYQESDIILAVRFLLETARSLRRPLALCIALGTTQSGHDGLGATSGYLGFINQMPQIGVSIAAGNEGNNQRHYYGILESPTYTGNFELNVSNKEKKFAFEIWAYQPSRLGLEIITPAGESTGQIFPQLKECRKFNFIFESSVVWVNNIILEEETGDQLILVRLENPLAGIWRFQVHNIENEATSYHAWLPSGELISNETYFLGSNPDTTVTSPGNAANTMTITAYNQNSGNILLESGRGYTRNNRIKPELAAPGYSLTCATINGGYGAITGTGAATAYATGIVAMVLEWAVSRGNYTSINGTDISNLLIRGAARDAGITYPNNIWGYGKIDIDGFFLKLRT